jgi:Mrp family chromosome partitioning ATPase/capsular polysaccharide biosynthesis protein
MGGRRGACPHLHANAQGGEAVTPGTRGADDHTILEQYLRALRLYWWVVVAAAVVVGLTAYVVSARADPVYEARATLYYGNEVGDYTALALELAGVNTTLERSMVVSRAQAAMGGATPVGGDAEVSAEPVSMSTSASAVGALSATRLVVIIARAGTANGAALLANAYAEAFVDYRTALVRQIARAGIKVVRQQLTGLQSPEAQAAAGIESVTATYVTLSQRLAELQYQATEGTGGYVLVKAAVPPAAPASPRPLRSAVLGFGVGLVVALLLLLPLYRLRPRLGGDEDVADLLRLPIIGRLPYAPSAGTAEALTSSADAEAYRRLRAVLVPLVHDGSAKTLLFTGAGDGGAGAAVLARLGLLLAQSERRVVLVDADLRSPSLHALLGLPNGRGVSTVVGGGDALTAALQTAPDLARPGGHDDGGQGGALEVLTSGPPADQAGDLVATPAMAGVLAELRETADVVLVHAPGLLEAADASALAGMVDALVVFVDRAVARRRTLRQCRAYLDLTACRLVGVVILNKSKAAAAAVPRTAAQASPELASRT